MEITLTPAKLAEALQVAYQADQPLFVWGAPGLGKSSIVRQVAQALGIEWIDFRAPLHDPTDLMGLPILTDGTMHFARPSFLPTSGNGILCFDELNRGSAMIQNACFQVILDRCCGEHKLPAGWVPFGCGNRETDGGGVTKMPAALANRFVHITLVPDLQDWCKWALTAGVNPVTIAFLRFRPDLLNMFDPNSRAFPTPRSWEFVSKITSQAMAQDVERALVAGAVGAPAATEYLAFISIYRKLQAHSIDAILLDPTNAPVPTDVQTLYAIAVALAARAEANNFGRVMTYLARIDREYSVFAVRDIGRRKPELRSTAEYTRWAIDNNKIL